MGKYCIYNIKGVGQTFNSYSELLNYLYEYFGKDENNNKLRDISDIVYSKTLKQDTVIDKLERISKTREMKSPSSLIDGEPTIDGAINILQFLDMPQCNIQRNPLVTPYNVDDYRANSIEDLQKEGYSEKEATKMVDQEIANWEYIKEDAKFIHGLADSTNIWIKDEAEYLEKIKDKLPDRMKDVAISLRDQFKNTWAKEKGSVSNAKSKQGVNIISKVKGFDQDLLGHIDWLFVGEDGTLHLNLIKVSTQNSKDWVAVKRQKYKYQLAFLSQMLAYNGFDVKNIELNIIPVKLIYGNNGRVLKAYVQSTEHFSTRSSDPEYAMHKYKRAAKYFIQDNFIPDHVSSEPITRALEVSRAIFPTVNLRSNGIGQSAQEWIKFAPVEDPTNIEPLIIKRVNERDHAYEVTLNGKVYNIKSSKEKERNPEILKLVTDHLNKLEDEKGYSTQRVKEAIKNSYDKGFMTFSTTAGLKGNSIQLESVLRKYIMDYTENEKTGERTYKWKLLDNLLDANCLLFLNTETNTLDIVTLSTFDVRAKAILRHGTNNILGCYRRNSESINLESDYGNIETVRTMELLNEVIPHLGDNIKLGTIGILSSTNGAPYRCYNIGEFNKKYFNNIITVVNQENPNLHIQNNFSKNNTSFVDPVEEILDEFLNITNNKSESYTKEYNQLGFEELKSANNLTSKLQALENILLRIQNSGWASYADPRNLEAALNQSNEGLSKNMAKLYQLVSKAYLQLRNETPSNVNSFNDIQANFFTAPTVNDENLRIIVNNLQLTHDTVAEEFLKEYEKTIPNIFKSFYDQNKYSQAQNMLIGNQASQFSNVIDNENSYFSFKNPYDPYNDLKPHEREMLKKVLFQIDKINRNGNSQFSSPTDSKIPNYIKAHPEYLFIPMERASNATKRQTKEGILSGMRNFTRAIMKASTAFDEFVEGITPEEREIMGKDSDSFYRMHLKNPFSLTMPSSNRSLHDVERTRLNMLSKYGKGFFETNVENILIDFLAKHISTTQYNKLLVASKALMLELHLTGNYNGNREVVEKEIKWIQDYLKVNVFQTSIMSPTEKKIVGVISPIKHIVTHMLLGGNLISAVRDSMEGAEQNFIRSVIKLNTDITPKEVSSAYAYVFTHSSSNAMAQNLLSKLCLKYRISNTDVGRISERAKSNRTGILNWENIMYSTLRGPDFLNRMTLFVAKCIHDGVWDSFSLDKDGNLKYDWTKDKRFKALNEAPQNSPEYKKAKSLYFSRINEYNEEHPDNPIEMPDEGLPVLPEPYSRRSINAIRALGDNIYGSYDKGKKAMAEHRSYGFLFGSFSTWMNGIINNYFLPTQRNGVSQLQQKQEVDEQGRKLFFTDTMEITTEDTGIPVLKNVPIQIQGIFPTIGELAAICQDEGFKAAYSYLKGNPMIKANVLKLGSDALFSALFALLFGAILNPAYKDYKKNMKDNPVLQNLLAEILYKGSSRAYSQFNGPINIIEFFGENMNPPYYTAPVQVIKDAWTGLIGDKSWKYLLFDNTGLTRTFKDTAFAYIKSQQ